MHYNHTLTPSQQHKKLTLELVAKRAPLLLNERREAFDRAKKRIQYDLGHAANLGGAVPTTSKEKSKSTARFKLKKSMKPHFSNRVQTYEKNKETNNKIINKHIIK